MRKQDFYAKHLLCRKSPLVKQTLYCLRKREKGKTAIKLIGMFVNSHGKVMKLDLHRMSPRGRKRKRVQWQENITALHEVMMKSYGFC